MTARNQPAITASQLDSVAQKLLSVIQLVAANTSIVDENWKTYARELTAIAFRTPVPEPDRVFQPHLRTLEEEVAQRARVADERSGERLARDYNRP
jgi:hypothetical protein